MVVDATDGHHMFGRQNDVPGAIIALCRGCHMKLHNGQIDREDVIKIQIRRGYLTDGMAEILRGQKIRGETSVNQDWL